MLTIKPDVDYSVSQVNKYLAEKFHINQQKVHINTESVFNAKLATSSYWYETMLIPLALYGHLVKLKKVLNYEYEGLPGIMYIWIEDRGK